jgi:hypothetical protein
VRDVRARLGRRWRAGHDPAAVGMQRARRLQLGRHGQACPQQVPLVQDHAQPVHLRAAAACLTEKIPPYSHTKPVSDKLCMRHTWQCPP